MELKKMTSWKGKKYSNRHGGPFDRGSADAFYRRPRSPHYFVGATYATDEIREENMTPEEVEAYHAGFDWQVDQGEFKEY